MKVNILLITVIFLFNAQAQFIPYSDGVDNPANLAAAGSLLTHDGSSDVALPVGTEGQVLSIDTNEPTKLKWVTPVFTSPTTTQGDMIIRGVTGNERLPIGNAGQVLQSNGTTATWQDATATTSTDGENWIAAFSRGNWVQVDSQAYSGIGNLTAGYIGITEVKKYTSFYGDSRDEAAYMYNSNGSAAVTLTDCATLSAASQGGPGGGHVVRKNSDFWVKQTTSSNDYYAYVIAATSSSSIPVIVRLGTTSGNTSPSNALGTNEWDAGAFNPTSNRVVLVAKSGDGQRVAYQDLNTTFDRTGAFTLVTPPTANAWDALTFADGLFVAVSSTGTLDRVMTSPDGITWTTRTTPADAESAWVDITYNSTLDKFVAVAESGAKRIMYSSDGINWSTANTPAGYENFAFESVSSNDYGFVAVSSDATGSKIISSASGVNWAIGNTDKEVRELTNVSYIKDHFCAIDNDGSATQYLFRSFRNGDIN